MNCAGLVRPLMGASHAAKLGRIERPPDAAGANQNLPATSLPETLAMGVIFLKAADGKCRSLRGRLPAPKHNKEASIVTRRLLLAGATVLAATPTVAFQTAVAAETGTVKTVTIVSRPDGTSVEQFVQRLQAEYAPLANKLPGQRGLIVSRVVKSQPRDDVKLLQIGPFDAIIDSYYASLADQERAAASPEGRRLMRR